MKLSVGVGVTERGVQWNGVGCAAMFNTVLEDVCEEKEEKTDGVSQLSKPNCRRVATE